ncbi:MAG TPA: DMT family transporter [bacterium]|jgi:drug/metabolite transporter (DMT)-like permease|nr:DMT family transporter [bacterium]
MNATLSSRDTRGAFVLLTLGMLCFGGTWVAGALAVEAIPPATIAVLRFALAAFLLWAWDRAGGRRRGPLQVRDLPLILALGATAVAGYNIAFLNGLRFAPASDGAIIVPGFAPILTAVLAWPLLGERIGLRGISGLLIGFAGVLLVMRPGGGTESGRLAGDLLFFTGAVGWAIYTLVGRAATARFTPVGATLYAFVSGTVMLLPFAVLERGWRPLQSAPAAAWAGVLYLALFGSVLAFVLFYEGLHRVGASRAVPFAFLVPIFGVVSSVIILDEELHPLAIAGGALVLLGLWMVLSRPAVKSKIGTLRTDNA